LLFSISKEICYGIEHAVIKITLHLIGKLTYELKGDIIVVHLKNNRGRVLVAGTIKKEMMVLSKIF